MSQAIKSIEDSTLSVINEHKCFGGTLGYYKHAADTTNCDMQFTVFIPEQAKTAPVPVLYYLSGLTCTEDNFTTKAGAYRMAAELGIAIIAPDTSPRGDDVPDDDFWDFGKGAGFYLDATQEPWSTHYNMYSYVTKELPALLQDNFPLDLNRQSIFGHSMGGHGALTIYLKNPSLYKSVSAFSPIVAPMQVDWGQKAFGRYLGDDQNSWKDYDATELLRRKNISGLPTILIDQGTADTFLENYLKPELFTAACQETGQDLTLRMQDGYDHSYFFIQSFIEDHIKHHAKYLGV